MLASVPRCGRKTQCDGVSWCVKDSKGQISEVTPALEPTLEQDRGLRDDAEAPCRSVAALGPDFVLIYEMAGGQAADPSPPEPSAAMCGSVTPTCTSAGKPEASEVPPCSKGLCSALLCGRFCIFKYVSLT